ncbi:hypothetical protein PSM7751_00036 [Pseudooceanicola marinus]|uniref:DUF2061 domain-containing protein n=1 Tax=Pseudooceanicola marinus TaxID=396013 RepID=A0A1X6Y643_9RHOB|nr:DUF2061 domain-containing protein [Pseudooceanicola marinus]PJE33422.1 DUF2061 domain-containing protein [Pseudooceanicola marinus]SLN10079.1 hypothetical protein PSM7751_00036 [Pseudooceanicola marinus]
MDTPQRSLVKALLWTLLGLLMMSLVGLLFTGSVQLGGAMALVNAALGLLCYMGYERIWDRIGWGRLDG